MKSILLSLKDVCSYLGISRHTVYRMIKSGALPAKRAGGQWRFEQADVDKLSAGKPNPVVNPKPSLMSVKEVCEFLGLCRQTIYALNKQNQLMAIKTKGGWKFPSQDVREFLTKNRKLPLVFTDVLTTSLKGGPLKIEEVAQLLGLNRRTVYRLVKENKLPATKMAGVWRFTKPEVSRYVLDKKYNHGTYGAKGQFFRIDVLDKYRRDNKTYYLRENAYDGFVGNREDYFAQKEWQSKPFYKKIKHGLPRLFAEVHYRKVAVRDGVVLVLTPAQYHTLPAMEQNHWADHQLPDEQIGILRQ